ncbi:MAG: hypothetical protein HDQ95_14820 [Roseburia sp.]|nr:hypothetical protein [Roseburia sp.]
MSKKAKMEGGFAYQNAGKTENCYAAVKIGAGRSENAGFIYNNKGEALHCFTRSAVRGWKRASGHRKQKDGFSSINSGTVSQCFFLVKKDKKLKRYRDKALGLAVEAAEPEQVGADYDWNYDVFERENAAKMDFFAKSWNYDPFDGLEEVGVKIVKIKTEDGLLDFIDRVNRGEPEAVNAKCELAADLDFHGRKIPSIGYDRQHPFCGTFDGKGHKIKGFVLSGKGMAEIGFFGCLKGSVINLSVDGIIKADNCPLAAGFCAVNEGEIHCCEAVIELHARRYAGMFVGENNGLIERCSVSGISCGVFLLWLWPVIPVCALTVGILSNPPLPPEDYVPVMEDASIIPNEDFGRRERTNENKASYEVPKILKVDAGTLTAKSEPYVIQNPDRGANYDFVVVLYMTDSSGRDVEVYRSGRIPVGYHIENLTLAPPDGITLTAGSYEAKMAFSFYHHDTGEKGMIDSAVPITVEIE